MSPTENSRPKDSTAGEPLSEEVIRNAPLVPDASSKPDSSTPSGGEVQRVPSSGGAGTILLKCRVRQGRLGRDESSTRG